VLTNPENTAYGMLNICKVPSATQQELKNAFSGGYVVGVGVDVLVCVGVDVIVEVLVGVNVLVGVTV
jgi:hypothetical protein